MHHLWATVAPDAGLTATLQQVLEQHGRLTHDVQICEVSTHQSKNMMKVITGISTKTPATLSTCQFRLYRQMPDNSP